MDNSDDCLNNKTDLLPGLSIIHSNYLENLRAVAVEWIRKYPLSPLENEIFLVQSNGMAQWLKLAMAEDEGCGISAALDIQLPGRFMWQAFRAVLGNSEIPFSSPFDKERLLWRLMRLMPELLSEPCFSPLARFFLDEGASPSEKGVSEPLLQESKMRKRYQLARQVADLFDQYQVYRADWLENWAKDQDCLINAKGRILELSKEQIWQPELWRRIKEDVPPSLENASRGELHKRFLKAAEALSVPPRGIPRRVIVFGLSSLPAQVLEMLHALSRLSQILLFVHNPCRHYWADIIEDRDLLRIEQKRHQKRPGMPEPLDPDSMHQHVNPILAAWGRQGRDYIGLLYGYDRPDDYQGDFASIDIFEDVVPDGLSGNLLNQVQQAVLDLEPLPGSVDNQRIDRVNGNTLDDDILNGNGLNTHKKIISKDDRSITFQTAHSRQREVEVLQDHLLLCFEENPDLSPRDIIVMTPDIDAYAPHIKAVFGNIDKDDKRYIPFSIADNPESSAVPLVLALEKLLGLPDCRMGAGDLMELLEVCAFRKRFGLKSSDLPMLQQWIQGAGVCWGLDGEHRTGFDLPPGLEQNTWMFGLGRMLLGYASGSGQPWNGIEPYDEIGGLDAALVGPLSSIIEKLQFLLREITLPVSPPEWAKRIRKIAADFFEPDTSRDRLLLNQLEEVLDRWLNACRDADFDEPLTRAVVRDFILAEMTESSISQRFLSGMVNFCTLMPMRAIPFKVVCILGMNDGDYPRSRPPMDFDLMAEPGCFRPGDRSRREDDRYLFLEALLSAREKLHISFIGRSIRDNSERTPSVLIGQLQDYLDAGWRLESGEDILTRLTCRHPLQPFSREYFKPGRSDALFTYAREWREILDTPPGNGGHYTDNEILDSPQFEGSLQINHLIRFMKNPVKFFFNQRLKVYFDGISVTTSNQEPFALEKLAPFDMGEKLLHSGLEAYSLEHTDINGAVEAVHHAAKRLLCTGELPMKAPGEMALNQLTKPVLAMLEHHHRLCRKWPRHVDSLEMSLPVNLPGCGCEALEDWLDRLWCRELTDRDEASTDQDKPSSFIGQPGHPLRNPLINKDIKTFARWEFYPGDISDGRGKITRLSAFVSLWVRHIAGSASGIELCSFLVAPDAVAGFLPIDRESASKYLYQVIDLWWQGMACPLPVTAKTGMAWLKEACSGIDGDISGEKEEKARTAARKAYQGDGYNSVGELGYSPYLKRAYPDFDDIWNAGKNTLGNAGGDAGAISGGNFGNNPFVHLSTILYQPLIENLETGMEGEKQ